MLLQVSSLTQWLAGASLLKKTPAVYFIYFIFKEVQTTIEFHSSLAKLKLTPWGLNKTATIVQIAILNAYSSMKQFQFWL